ncbi:MAG: CPBP family intramembrane metalloprotease [Tepidisphaeraceae bacterium]
MASYFEQSEKPWPSLIVVMPLVAVYELGTRGLLTENAAGPEQLIAFDLLRQAFFMLGATGSALPAMTLIACLLGWHLARKDSWRVQPTVVGGMVLESLLLAVPLTLLAIAMARTTSVLSATSGTNWVLMSIGAGVYEELIFRLVGFTVLHAILKDLLNLPSWITVGTMVAGSAAAFSAYHGLGSETLVLPSFVFRMVAGILLGAIFLTRGFGVTALSHVAYNLILLGLRQNAVIG